MLWNRKEGNDKEGRRNRKEGGEGRRREKGRERRKERDERGGQFDGGKAKELILLLAWNFYNPCDEKMIKSEAY